VLTAI